MTRGTLEIESRAILEGPEARWDHVDGPMLYWAGHVHWLTWSERLALRLGMTTVEELGRQHWEWLETQRRYLIEDARAPLTVVVPQGGR